MNLMKVSIGREWGGEQGGSMEGAGRGSGEGSKENGNTIMVTDEPYGGQYRELSRYNQ